MTREVLEEEVPVDEGGETDEGEGEGEGDERGGWLIKLAGDPEPVVVTLLGTADERLGTHEALPEVMARFKEARVKGGLFHLGSWFGSADHVLYVAWADSVLLPGLDSRSALHDQLEDLAEAVKAVAVQQEVLQKNHSVIQAQLSNMLGGGPPQDPGGFQAQTRAKKPAKGAPTRQPPRPLKFGGQPTEDR